MARLNPSPIRMYRGTTEQHSQYAGPIGELTVDTDKNTVVVQNGTDGGVPLAQERRQVIAGDGLKVNGGASGTLASDITMAVDQTWLDSYIDGLVNDGNLVTAGDGVDVTASDGVVEIAVDDTVVRTRGDQTINGKKTFRSYITVNSVADKTAIVGAGVGYNSPELHFYGVRFYRPVDEELYSVPKVPSVGLFIGRAQSEAEESTPDEPCVAVNNVSSYEYPAEVVNVQFLKDYLARADNGVVHTTGNETIAGRKIFESDVFIRQAGSCDVFTVNTAVTKGTPPVADDNAVSRLILSDNTGLDDVSVVSNRLASVDVAYTSTGSTYACLLAYKPEAGSEVVSSLGVHYPSSGAPYAVAPNTRSTPSANEIITFDFLKNYVTENADNSVYLPLYFQVGTTEEIHTFLPAGVTTVRRANFEADGAGTGGLALTMTRDIGATTSMTVGSSATDCSAYAGHAVMFTISGTSDQTEVAAMLVFE